jgi:hypothetical protein
MEKNIGVDFPRKLLWAPDKKRVLQKARKNWNKGKGMGIQSGIMKPRGARVIWFALARSILENASAIWGEGEWEEAEKLQYEALRFILGCGPSTPLEVLLGETGFWKLKTRRDFARLKFWHKLLRTDRSRVLRKVYEAGRRELNNNGQTNSWSHYTREFLRALGFSRQWNDQYAGSYGEWIDAIAEALQKREERQWREGIQRKVKLRIYNTVKVKWGFEGYLDNGSRKGRSELTKLRGGVSRLRIEQGRYVGLARHLRLCWLCGLQVEDEEHFLCQCSFLENLRSDMWLEISRGTNNEINREQCEEEGTDYVLKILLGSAANKHRELVRSCTIKYVSKAMKRRESLMNIFVAD